MNEIDALLAGFAGGCISSSVILLNYYFYIRAKTMQYVRAKDDMQNHLAMRNAVLNIKEMQAQIRELYEEINEIDLLIKKSNKNS
jgi:hypothetical protein